MSFPVPVEAGETLAFTPHALDQKLEKPPIFRLRAVTYRERRHFDSLMRTNRVRQYGVEDIRKEILNAVQNVCSPESAAEIEPRLKEFWEAVDQHSDEQDELPADERTAFEHPDIAAIEKLSEQLADAWPPLAQMNDKNVDWFNMMPLIAVATAVTGWDNFACQFSKEFGFLTIESADDVRNALYDLDKANGITGGLSWSELYSTALGRIFLPKEQEKNSQSPSPSSKTPRSSKTGTASKAGKSPATATSTTTPAT